MRTIALEKKLLLGQATEIQPEEGPSLDVPHYHALSDIEREIYRLKMAGMRLQEIEEVTNLKIHDLSRIIKGIKDKFAYMARFWEILQGRPDLKEKFFCEKNCPKKDEKGPSSKSNPRHPRGSKTANVKQLCLPGFGELYQQALDLIFLKLEDNDMAQAPMSSHNQDRGNRKSNKART
jgi:hypothetical protein